MLFKCEKDYEKVLARLFKDMSECVKEYDWMVLVVKGKDRTCNLWTDNITISGMFEAAGYMQAHATTRYQGVHDEEDVPNYEDDMKEYCEYCESNQEEDADDKEREDV